MQSDTADDYLEVLGEAWKRLLEDRRNVAKLLAKPYEPGKTEEWRESFVKIQQTIEAVNRAIREEAELEGHKYPSEKQSGRS